MKRIPFFSRLSYSFGNEDCHTEREALNIQPSDRVVCITASGDRPLHLLLDECEEVVSVDLNPVQNYLLYLKMAALEHLAYEEYLNFLGANASNNRKEVFGNLSPHLPEPVFNFWKDHISMIEKGVLYQGAVEKVSKKIAKVVGIFRKKKIERLFKFNDLHEQREFIRKEWDTYCWRKTFEFILNPTFSKLWMKDPGLYEYLGQSMHPGIYMYNRIHTNLIRHLAKENMLLSFVFLGRVGKEAYPPYLTLEGTRSIKPHLRKIKIKHDNIVNFLENEPDESFDCFSISDVASYLSPKDFLRLLKAIHRTARPKARFCLRQFLSSHVIPKEVDGCFQFDHKLAKHLKEEDQTIFYRFLVGTVNK